MGCEVSREQLWSWIDRDAPELDSHLTRCERCRSTAVDIRRKIDAVTRGAGPQRPVPETVGPYVIQRFLGEGGQALVYEAEQPNVRRAVALKVLKGGRFASERAVHRFQREARALGQLQHPGIATVYEAGRTDGGLNYLAMERVHGVPLDVHVRERELTGPQKLELFQSVCRAVQFAHQRGVIHRDLKPSNILVQEDGSPKILDFGLAKLLRSEYVPTITATLVASGEGTPRYMSPEQAMGAPADIDERTDVFSLGVILYEMLTGQAPYVVSHVSPVALYEESPPSPRVLSPDLGADLETILLTALEKDPSQRYASVEALAADIDRYVQARPIQARRPGWIPRARRQLRPRAPWLAVAALAIVALGIFGARRTAPPPFDRVSARLSLLELRRDLFVHGDDPVVLSRANAAAQRFARLPEATLLRGHMLVAGGDMNLAAVMLRGSLENDPSQWPLEAMLREIEARREHREEPVRDVPFPDTTAGWTLRSFASIDAHRALEFAAVAFQHDRADPVTLATMAYLSEAVEHHEDALQWASRLIAVTGHVPRWMIYKSNLLCRLGRYQDALGEADTMVAVRPDDPSARHLRARIARRLRRYDVAVSDLTRSIQIYGSNHPTSAWPHYHRGSAHWLNGQPEAAARDYQKAYELLTYPTYANARLYLVQRDLGWADQARASLDEARRRVWDDPWLSRILDGLAEYVSPQELIDAAEGDKQLCEALYYAAEVYRLQGRRSEAIETYRACLDLGIESDPDQDTDTMTEYELSIWRLSQLVPARDL